MSSISSLVGRTVLVVEDEPLIALDMCESLQGMGASVLTAQTLCAGLRLAGRPDVSVAVLDFGLSDGKCTAICERLKEEEYPSCFTVAMSTLPRHAVPPRHVRSVAIRDLSVCCKVRGGAPSQ